MPAGKVARSTSKLVVPGFSLPSTELTMCCTCEYFSITILSVTTTEPDLRDAADVVTREVDQHHVFGDFLRVVQQFGGEFGIALGRVAARTRAGERPDRDDAIFAALFLAHQNFRRRTDHVKSPPKL